ncbi:TIGR04053 family radical SAM/SPASM domain-containing protein [Aeoliella sp. ICT_H6.2]|uniref:TIGR04053 family radical SAM/SPASM domain-containing protein n=1 Tax=Aeoliella straminimaris TaxID=2954799 RepID=A0A9X2FFA7_9BACT|nr:TIGR04053 family radical SAM/SPASM domain-containing protein [Aeoliella straminimaris]MCO6043006.1 TIGR04053 family radical SAM/SPASM domain-containing protein [Aeoliella straminimaris]
MLPINYTEEDFATSPLMFYYEVTQACDLVCKHCRASAQPEAHPGQLSPEESRALIDQVTQFPKPPTLVFTGGDPLKRPDLFDLIRHARSRDLRVALTPSATPLATYEALANAKEAGVSCLGVSLDGADAETHDAFRGWSGSYDRTMEMLEDAKRLGLPVQVNTTVTKRNVGQLDPLADQLAEHGIMMWAVFFLVPVGRGIEEQRLSADECEEVFELLWRQTQRQPYAIKTTEAPHYRRFVMQHQGDPLAGRSDSHGRRAPLGVRDGKGIMFVAHDGQVFPAGFLPLECGRFPEQSVVDAYQQHPNFRTLRDHDLLQGKCGLCEYRSACGGSRSRAFALTGDPMAEEPDCRHQPEGTGELVETLNYR